MKKIFNLFVKFAVVFIVFTTLSSNLWADSSNYARGYAIKSSSSADNSGKVYVNCTSAGGTQPATPAANNSSWQTSTSKTSDDAAKTSFDFYFYSLPSSGYALEGWSETDGASDYSTSSVAKHTITTSSSTLNTAYTDFTLYAHFVPNPTVTVTFLTPDSKCSYTAKCNGANVPVGSSIITNKSFDLAATVNDAGYKLLGWYTTTDGGATKSYFSPNDTYTNKYFPKICSVGVDLVEASKPVFMVGDKLFTDLNAANSAASSGSNKTIVLVSDGLLDAGNYTISSGNTLLIPHTIGSTFVNSKSVITEPYIVRAATKLSAFRKLTLQDGVNITVNGKICVAGKMMSAGGGKTSAYPTGECGMIDMSRGGHIELNNGAILYTWGFIKGQDMEQGNNTAGVGTITANSGAVIWEGFATGDWRGGSASSTIYSNADSWKFFPFQSYTIQNIEIPVTYNYGSKLSNLMSIFGDGQVYNGTFDLVGSSNTLFLLKDSGSKLKKWYDPTTDLVCYEMSGTTQLDALNVDAAGETVSSKDYNLPVSTSMHIILASSTTISKPVEIQAGAVVEVKSGATLTCSSNIYLFDKDNWGAYCYKKYYYTMANLTNHKNRGNGTSNELIDDAKFIVDGTLNMTGKMYTTEGGADIMSNGGGKIVYSALPSATNIVMCTDVSTNENVAVASANLHNEDGSYTKSIASTTFHNVHGRWFVAADKDEKENHTYNFTYITSGAVSGTGGTSGSTPAVYSWDKKAALDLTQKWHNVTADACPNWWVGTDTYFYNWTENSAWHQFIPTATAGMYSGSNNKIYTKTDCIWKELGETDVNCLYTIGGVKKALVDGEFIALEPNNNDPAYHAAEDATKYYICFEGCNWHAADKYTEAEKAYVVGEDIFIWYNGVWMKAEWKDPFFYTLSETDVPIYYEYLNGEWVLAEPYVSVVDGIESRNYWFLEDAFTFANSVLRTAPTITILRDISGITTALSYTGANKTCTLDLNGYIVSGAVPYVDKNNIGGLLVINASGSTFTITDKSGEKNGRIENSFAQNTRTYGVNLTNGTLVLEDGIIFAENTLAYNSSSAKSTAVSAVYVAAGQTFTMNAGSAHAKGCYAARGVDVAGSTSANATVNINAGTVTAETTQASTAYGIYAVGGTTKVKSGATINAIATTTTAYGICIDASTKKYFGSLEMAGGTVNVESRYTSTSKDAVAAAVYVGGTYIMTSTKPNKISDTYRAVANISGGTFNVSTTTARAAYGVRTRGTTTITGGTFNVTPKTTMAYGILAEDGTTKVSGSATFTATATATAYGIFASGVIPDDKTGRPYNPVVTVDGGTFNVQTTSKTTAYGINVTGATRPITSTADKYFAGNYVSAGNVTVNGGTFNITAKTTAAYGAVVAAPKTESGAEGYAAATANPKCTINGGYFKMVGTGDVNGVNTLSTTDNFKVQGGYYSHEGNIETYTVSPKHVVELPQTDSNRPDYEYKVAEAYTVTFKNGSETLQSSYQEKGKTPVYEGDAPTKASTSTTSYIFDGWSTTDGGAVVSPLPNVTSAGATYYAHYTETALKYIATFDAKTNGGAEENQVIYVEPDAAIGTLPTATKEGYTFSGWFTAASGGTKITTATVPTGDVTYYAQFTVNKYTLTWKLGDGVVSAVGKYGSTSWPAKKATGTQSKAVSYGLTLTAPTVTRTGYTFHSWLPLVAATMPAEAVTYTAQWTPKTNTAYTVKHYLQNVDGTYPEEPVETDALTGTTGESVTPEVKEYEGFVSPETETKEIAADGTMVIEYKYERMHYTITLDAATNGGTSEQPTIEVIHGATIGTVPPDAQKGCNDFTGWYTKPVGGVKITSDFTIEYNLKTLYAQFSDDVRTYPITYNAGANGTGTVAGGTKTCGEDATLSSSTFTRDGYAQTGWSLTDGGAQAYALGGTYTENAALTLYPVWTVVSYNLTYEGLNGATNSNPVTYTIETATITLADPGSRAGYTFTGWTCGGSPLTQITLGSTGDKVITANWEKIGVTILWKSEDGETTLETDEGVEIDATPSFNGETPTKTTTAEYTYTFDGWTTEANGAGTFYAIGELPAVAAAAAYYAHFTATPNVASVTVGGATTYYPTIADAWEAVNTATGAVTLKLLQDVSGITTSLAYTNAQNCTLDLNNHTLSGTIAGNLLNINATGKTFTIDDSSAEKGGRLENSKAGKARYYAVYLSAGILNLEHGTIHSSNPSDATYSTLTSNAKKCMASGVYVTAKQTFNMNGGAVSASAIYNPIGVQTAGVTNLKGGSVTATATKFTTAVGVHSTSTTKIYDGVTITASSTKSTTVYGVQVAGSTTTFYGGTIKAHATSSKGTTVSGIYVSSGTASIPATSTVDVEAKSYGKNCYGIQVAGGKRANIYGGTFSATSTNANAAYSVYSLGTTNITGGTFTATAKTSNARGVSVPRGTTTISGDPEFTVKAPSSVYGALASATTPSKAGVSYYGTLIIKGGTFDVEATSTTTAFGVYAGQGTGLSMFSTTNDSVPGNYINAGTAEISGGVFNVTAKTSTAYGVFVNKGTQNKNTTMDAVTASGTCTVSGGKFNVSATSSVGAVNTVAANTDLIVTGGWYNVATNLATKYTAPMKDCNYHALPLTGEDPYKWEVAEAYTVTFKNGEDVLQSTIVKKGATPSYIGVTPTKTEDENYTYTFSEWSPAITAATADAIYTATFTQTQKQKDITLKENGDNDYYDTFKAAYDGKTMNVTYKRQFAEGRWSTMCLPFNVNYATMKTFGMYGCVYEFKYAEGNANVGSGVNLYFSNAKSIEAGKCYIVNANSALETKSKTPFVFAGVTIDLSKDNGAALDSEDAYDNLPGYKSQGTIELVGTLRNGTLQGTAAGNTYMGLKENKIYYPNTDQGSTIWAYRGIFRSTSALNIEKMRIVVDGEDRGELIIDADGDVRAPSGAASRKFIENGVLYVEREGAVYDATGRKVE